MGNPTIALLWQCWRLTRRWGVFFMAIAIVIHLGTMNLLPANAQDYADRNFLASQASIGSFILASFATLIVISVSGRAGFPLCFEYRLPIDLKLLAVIPLLYLSATCASLYVVPVLLTRLLYNVSMPLAAPVMMVATSVAALAAASWSTTGTYTRTLAVIVVSFGLVQLYGWVNPLAPIALVDTRGPSFTIHIIALTFLEYGFLVLLLIALFSFIVHNLKRQRCNESLVRATLFTRKVITRNAYAQHSHDATTEAVLSDRKGLGFVATIANAIDVPCPLSSACSAELWFEFKRHGTRILILGVLLALSIPLFLLLAKLIGVENRGNLAWLPVAAAFFGGVGISFINRRQDSSGYMNAFEGTRSMSTLQIAGIQFLVAGATTLIGVLLTSISLWLSLPLLDAPGTVIAKAQEVLAAPWANSLIAQTGELFAAFTLYVTLIAFLACLHACSVFWGRKVLYGMTIFVIYCIIFTFNVVRGAAVLEDIQQHMWAFAGVVMLLTLFILDRVLYMKTLSLSSGVTSLAGWGIFLLCSWLALKGRGVVLTNQAPELLAFNTALLTLPFTLFLLTAWSYDRLRHR